MNMRCHRCEGLLTHDSSWSLTEASTCFEYLRCVSRGAMLVKGIMVGDVRSCGPDASAATAMGMMWEQDCGVLPVVDSERRVVGMVTDLDLATAMATRNRLASEITVQDVLNGPPCCCSPDDGIKHALMTMASHKIRRLPVVTTDGSLRGIFSIEEAGHGKGSSY